MPTAEQRPELVGISLGGSTFAHTIIPDIQYLGDVAEMTKRYPDKRFVFITGGGIWARIAQEICKWAGIKDKATLDRVAIPFTHINAIIFTTVLLVHHIDAQYIRNISVNLKEKMVTVTAGNTVGQTTDGTLVDVAEKLQISHLINVTNVKSIYKQNRDGTPNFNQPQLNMTWRQIFLQFGTVHVPGAHTPIGIMASLKANKLGLTIHNVYMDVANVENAINKKPYIGTTISP